MLLIVLVPVSVSVIPIPASVSLPVRLCISCSRSAPGVCLRLLPLPIVRWAWESSRASCSRCWGFVFVIDPAARLEMAVASVGQPSEHSLRALRCNQKYVISRLLWVRSAVCFVASVICSGRALSRFLTASAAVGCLTLLSLFRYVCFAIAVFAGVGAY